MPPQSNSACAVTGYPLADLRLAIPGSGIVWTGWTSAGCVAKNEWGYKRSDPDPNLCGNHEEIRHESDLPLNGAFAYSINLSFSDHVHCLVPADRPTRRVETGKPKPGIDSAFDESVVLFDDIIEIFALA